MAKVVAYIKISADGELLTDNFGKVYYDLTLKPASRLDVKSVEMLKNDLEDFELYLMQKYVTSNVKDIDKFPIWQKLKNAIKNIK